ncbi:MAG: helix-turn-helix domain-containing protein [Ruminococcaceae bacterium]|nr:helix-turn-helix domain-containing protein [Oscillospiraceae bacterium]
MLMFYNSQLEFLKSTAAKLRLRLSVVSFGTLSEEWAEAGFVHLVLANSRFAPSLETQFSKAENNIIYKTTDPFGACLIYFILPDTSSLLTIGPFLTKPHSRESILEQSEKLNLSHALLSSLEEYYGGLPIIYETSPLYAMLDSFGELIWGGAEHFSLSESGQETFVAPIKSTEDSEQSYEVKMKRMEERYNYENELMDAVSKGLSRKADLFLSNLSNMAFERRLSDPLRNLKNYAIIMNTLCRKAAERGDVHPVYLDSISSDFARRIEQVLKIDEMYELMADMFRSYCRLVRKHSMKDYSPPVRKAIIQIDSDLSSDLSLKKLAEAQNISSGYLSSLFSRETGQTVTEHIIKKRIKLARHLLTTTSLQVQTIAQHCGFPDLQYFSKVYKKAVGETPLTTRKNSKSN